MKKLLIVVLTFILSLSVLAACKAATKEPRMEDISIDVPDGEVIMPPPGVVEMPPKPELPLLELSRAPYIGATGATTEAYKLTEHRNGEGIVGVSIDYKETEPGDYHFVWLDVYNYTPEYSNIRFDFSSVDGAEKAAVSAAYMEAFDKDLPAVGVLVESLPDGAVSYVTDLKDFYVVDRDYKEGTEIVADKKVARLLFYFDSNPSQSPSDGYGSLDIEKVSFLKDGDPLLTVDNSPKIGNISGDAYTITSAATEPDYDKVFRAGYNANDLEEGSYVSVEVDRFSAPYGRIELNWTAQSVEKLTVTDGDNVLSGKDKDTGESVVLRDFAPGGGGKNYRIGYSRFFRTSGTEVLS